MEAARQSGFENNNAWTASEQLHCFTQPVMYHFSMMDNLRKAACRQADQLHAQYRMNTQLGQDPVLEIGMNHIRFAVKETQLFRFLFQSGYAKENSLLEMVDSEELAPVLATVQEGVGSGLQKTRDVFITTALFAHGYASINANHHLEFDETQMVEHLEHT